jgi:mannitol 2-dehydrogenase
VRAHRQKEEALRLLSSPAIRLVTLTVTEGGYFTHPVTGELQDDHQALRLDLEQPHSPDTMLGLLAEALNRRRQTGIAPFTLLSCDNLQHNGAVLKRVLCSFCDLRDPKLGAWVEREVSFPNSVVDRITPMTTDEDIQNVAERFNIVSGWPVIAEPYRQWVIEDRFPMGRPAWDRLDPESGILLTGDVTGYEVMKMRLLNGGHSALAYLGLLLQYRRTDEVMKDGLMSRFLARYFEEVSPLVPQLPGIDITRYKVQLIERFSNPFIGDQLARIAGDGSSKLTKWTMPSASELLKRGLPVDSLAMIVAAWFQYLGGQDELGKEIEIVDLQRGWLKEIVSATDGLKAFLCQESLFMEDLRQSRSFQSAVVRYVHDLQTGGVQQTLGAFLAT